MSCAIQIFGTRSQPVSRIDLDLDDRSRVRVGGRRADAGALVVAGRLRRAVAAGGAERAELRLGELHRLGERHAARRDPRASNTRRSAKTRRVGGELELLGDGAGEQSRAPLGGLRCAALPTMSVTRDE